MLLVTEARRERFILSKEGMHNDEGIQHDASQLPEGRQHGSGRRGWHGWIGRLCTADQS